MVHRFVANCGTVSVFFGQCEYQKIHIRKYFTEGTVRKRPKHTSYSIPLEQVHLAPPHINFSVAPMKQNHIITARVSS